MIVEIYTKMTQTFCNICIRVSLQRDYHEFKSWLKVPTVVGSIVVVGALTRCALLHSVCILKTGQMNMQKSLTR